MPAKKTAKKKPQTRQEENKRYLARKKAKEFEAALESPPAAISIPEEVVDALPEDEVELPPPSNTNFDDDNWEPYAPSPDNVPLAKGETQETAIKPGGWVDVPVTPDPVEADASLEESLEKPQDALEDAPVPDKHSMPLDSVERIQQAIDGIKWLSQKVRNLPPRTKEILRLRIIRLEELIRALQ